VFRLGPRGWLDLEQRNYNVAFDAVVGDAIDFEANHVRGLRSDEAARRVMEMLAGRSSLFSHQTFAGLLVPAVTGATRKLAQSEVGARQAGVALAIERYRREAGRLPATLDELVPKHMAKVPLDPCGGQPFRYRLTEGGKFLLYSVGWNEKDDGGVVVRKNESPGGQLDPTQGDWVWTY
jgi:hypothetical protein